MLVDVETLSMSKIIYWKVAGVNDYTHSNIKTNENDGDDCERWQNDTKMNINIFIYSDEKNCYVMVFSELMQNQSMRSICITLFTPEAAWSRLESDKHAMFLFIFWFIFIFRYQELRPKQNGWWEKKIYYWLS